MLLEHSAYNPENAVALFRHRHDRLSRVPKPLCLPSPIHAAEQNVARATELNAILAKAATISIFTWRKSATLCKLDLGVLDGFTDQFALTACAKYASKINKRKRVIIDQSLYIRCPELALANGDNISGAHADLRECLIDTCKVRGGRVLVHWCSGDQLFQALIGNHLAPFCIAVMRAYTKVRSNESSACSGSRRSRRPETRRRKFALIVAVECGQLGCTLSDLVEGLPVPKERRPSSSPGAAGRLGSCVTRLGLGPTDRPDKRRAAQIV